MKHNWIVPAVVVPITIVFVLPLQAAIATLPYPLSSFNSFVFALIFALLIWESGGVVWFAALLYAIVDWYTATPYGLVVISNTLAMLVVLWFYRSFFTNRSPVAAGALAALLTVSRIFLYALGYFGLSFLPGVQSPPITFLLTELVSEVGVTSVVVFVVYVGISRLVPALKVTHTVPLRNI